MLHRNHTICKNLIFIYYFYYSPHTKLVLFLLSTERVEPELLHTYAKVPGAGVIFVVVRLAVLMAVTLTVPIVIFPVSAVLLLWCVCVFVCN